MYRERGGVKELHTPLFGTGVAAITESKPIHHNRLETRNITNWVQIFDSTLAKMFS